jgi:hypothetical protein
MYLLYNSFTIDSGMMHARELLPADKTTPPIPSQARTKSVAVVRTYVDLLCSDDESLRNLEYKGEKGAYVISRERRRACPVASEMQYSEQQAAFHIAAFLGNRLG